MAAIDMNSAARQLLDDAVKQTFPGAAWESQGALSGGLSSSVLYKITVDARAYVARFSDPAHPHNNLAREYGAMRLASEQKLAPRLYYASEQTGLVLMDFVASQPLRSAQSQGVDLINALARLIRTMHQGPAYKTDIGLADKVAFFYAQLGPELANMDLVRHAITQVRKLAPFLNDATDVRPSHCDINPGNLLFDGRQIWLIDWAAAAQENRYFDLACCCNFLFYQRREAEKAFVQAYFERPLTANEEENYARMRSFVTIYYGLLFIYLSGLHGASTLSKSDIEALPEYAQFLQRVGQGEEQLSSPQSQQRMGFVYLKQTV